MGSPSIVEEAAAAAPAQDYFSGSAAAAGLPAFGLRYSEQRRQAESCLVERCVASIESSENFQASAVKFAKNEFILMNISKIVETLT